MGALVERTDISERPHPVPLMCRTHEWRERMDAQERPPLRKGRDANFIYSRLPAFLLRACTAVNIPRRIFISF